jgi:hypothetical protein
MPGIDMMRSTAVRKGPRFASTCASSVAIVLSAICLWPRNCVSRKRRPPRAESRFDSSGSRQVETKRVIEAASLDFTCSMPTPNRWVLRARRMGRAQRGHSCGLSAGSLLRSAFIVKPDLAASGGDAGQDLRSCMEYVRAGRGRGDDARNAWRTISAQDRACSKAPADRSRTRDRKSAIVCQWLPRVLGT